MAPPHFQEGWDRSPADLSITFTSCLKGVKWLGPFNRTKVVTWRPQNRQTAHMNPRVVRDVVPKPSFPTTGFNIFGHFRPVRKLKKGFEAKLQLRTRRI